MNRLFSCLPPALCKLPFLCCLSVQASVSLMAAIQLWRPLQPHPMLSQLTSKSSGSKSHWFYQHRIWPLWFLKPNITGLSLPCVRSLMWGLFTLPFPCTQFPSSCGQSSSTFLTLLTFPYGFFSIFSCDFYFFFFSFQSLDHSLLSWRWISSCKCGMGPLAQGPPTPATSQDPSLYRKVLMSVVAYSKCQELYFKILLFKYSWCIM